MSDKPAMLSTSTKAYEGESAPEAARHGRGRDTDRCLASHATKRSGNHEEYYWMAGSNLTVICRDSWPNIWGIDATPWSS